MNDLSIMEDRFDAIVIGAGPAGCVAAQGLARRGVRTLLVDRAPFPRAKVCGGCLTPRAVTLLRELGLESAIARAGNVDTFRLCWHNRQTRIPIAPRVVVDRAAFDFALANQAEQAGATVMCSVSAKVDRNGFVVLRDASDTPKRVYGHAIIVADGLAGASLRDDPRFGWKIAPGSAVGMGVVVDQPPVPLEREILMSCTNAGYAGLAPLSDGRCVVAAAARVRGSAGSLEALLNPIAPGVRFPGVRGVPQLTRQRLSVEADARVFVIGDAAGYIEPFTGEGMAWAIEHATRVVPMAVRAIQNNYGPGSWTRLLRSLQKSQQKACRVVATILRHDWLVGTAVGACQVNPAFGELGAELIAGKWAGGVR